MARGSSKRVPKATKASNIASFARAGGPSTHSLVNSFPPTPFESAPATLVSLADKLPTNHIYVVHLESTTPNLRKQAFLVPVILNLIIAAGLCWRINYAVPVYLEQMITIFGYETPSTVRPKELDWGNLMWIIGARTLYLTVDYVLFGLIGRWPWEFVFGDKYGRHVGLCGWKWYVGFNRRYEPVIRRGRKWDTPIFQTEDQRKREGKPEKSWTKEEELAVYTKCTDGLRKFTTAKNALSLLDKDWDLDYKGMIDATKLLDAATISTPDIDHVALIPWQGRWYSWYPHKQTEANNTTVDVKEQDEKLERFKKNLIEMDCENVFYRWIEIVQYETSQPGGFKAAKKSEAEKELKRMLAARKKDADLFLSRIGGLQNVPGLEAEI